MIESQQLSLHFLLGESLNFLVRWLSGVCVVPGVERSILICRLQLRPTLQ